MYGYLGKKSIPAQFLVAEDRSRLISFRTPAILFVLYTFPLLGCFFWSQRAPLSISSKETATAITKESDRSSATRNLVALVVQRTIGCIYSQMFGTRRRRPCGIARSGRNDFVDSLRSALHTGHVHVFCIMHSQASYCSADLPTFFVHHLLSDSPYNGLY
jgi:hypothetical protein